jgi:hypothetical protein
MNAARHTIRNVAILTLTMLASALASQSGFAADCNNPAGIAERHACAKAAQGIDALRQFAQRTRAIHNVYLPDYEKALPARDLATAEPETLVATSAGTDTRTVR